MSDTPRTDTFFVNRQFQTERDLVTFAGQLERENAKLRRQIEIMQSSQHEFCPDCRDKVKSEPCLRCQVQALSAQNARLRVANASMTDR